MDHHVFSPIYALFAALLSSAALIVSRDRQQTDPRGAGGASPDVGPPDPSTPLQAGAVLDEGEDLRVADTFSFAETAMPEDAESSCDALAGRCLSLCGVTSDGFAVFRTARTP